MPGFPATFYLTLTARPLFFTARCLWAPLPIIDVLGWGTQYWAEAPHSSRVTSVAKIFPPHLQPPRVGMGPTCFQSLLLLLVSVWLLYILIELLFTESKQKHSCVPTHNINLTLTKSFVLFKALLQPFDPPNNSVTQTVREVVLSWLSFLLLIPFYKWENQGPKKHRDISMVILWELRICLLSGN